MASRHGLSKSVVFSRCSLWAAKNNSLHMVVYLEDSADMAKYARLARCRDFSGIRELSFSGTDSFRDQGNPMLLWSSQESSGPGVPIG